jgi:transposase-like protein
MSAPPGVRGGPRAWAEGVRRRLGSGDRRVGDAAQWVRQAEIDQGLKRGPATEKLAEIRQLRKEVADQQRTIEILKAATTYFAREADPRQR